MIFKIEFSKSIRLVSMIIASLAGIRGESTLIESVLSRSFMSTKISSKEICVFYSDKSLYRLLALISGFAVI